MRKSKFVTMATALVAVTTLFSSCWQSDEPVQSNEVSEVAPELYSVVASANAEAVFTVNVGATAEASMDKMSAVFSDIDTKNKTVQVTAKLVNPTGYVEGTQTATINFSGSMKSAAVAFDFAKASTDVATQAEVAAATTDVAVTSNTTAFDASLIIPPGVDVQVNTTDPFSVTAYEDTPNLVDVEKAVVGKSLPTTDEDVLILECTPNKAKFGKPLTLKVFVGKELAGETIEIENGGEKVSAAVKEDGYVEFKVSHFSPWNVLFNPVLSKIVSGFKTLADLKNVAIVNGKNSFSYLKNAGTESTSKGLISMFINQRLGKQAVSKEDKCSFVATGAGKASINVIQNYKDLTFKYGNATFTARVYGNSVTTVSIEGGGTNSNGHPAGSGK